MKTMKTTHLPFGVLQKIKGIMKMYTLKKYNGSGICTSDIYK